MSKSDQTQLDRVIADKARQRLAARTKSWPEKVATIERLRDTTRIARAAMKATSPPKPSSSR